MIARLNSRPLRMLRARSHPLRITLRPLSPTPTLMPIPTPYLRALYRFRSTATQIAHQHARCRAPTSVRGTAIPRCPDDRQEPIQADVAVVMDPAGVCWNDCANNPANGRRSGERSVALPCEGATAVV